MRGRERMLLHTCCAPCLTAVYRGFIEEGFNVTAFFYNPNIHPWKERERRLQSLEDYAGSLDIPLLVDTGYPLEDNVAMLLKADNRCRACFEDRLEATARRAAQEGMDCFSTTLSVSPYQNQDMIRSAGERAGTESGITFVYRDFRNDYRESVRMSREAGLYRQPYCGCVFSERDRYLKIRSPGQMEETGQ